MKPSPGETSGDPAATDAPDWLARFPAWLVPLLVGVVVFQPGLLNVGPDASWYWTLGKNLANGLGYVGSEWTPEIRRGPGLPLLLAGAFRVSADELSSAAWVVRACFVASALATYAVGARWFGRGVGVVAASGLLVDPIASLVGSSIGADVVGVSLVLVALVALERRGMRSACGAGVALAATALTREAALIAVVPLAVHAAFERDRAARLREIGVAVLLAASVLLAWLLWAGGAALVTDRFASFLGSGGASGAFSPSGVLEGLYHFAGGTALGTRFWPALALGWVGVAVCAFRGSSPDRLLLLLLLSLLPIAVLQGLYNLRAGQSYLLYPLSFLAFARSVELASQHFAPRFRVQALAMAAALVVAAGFAAWTPSYWIASWRIGGYGEPEYRTLNPLAIPDDRPRPKGWLNRVVRDAATWLETHTAPDDTWISDWYWADALYLSTSGSRPIHRLPYVRSRDVSHMALETTVPLPDVESYEPILFVFSQGSRTDPGHPDAWVNAFSEPLLFARLEQTGADWVIVTKRRIMLADYFDASPSFELAYRHESNHVRIYRVRRPLVATPFETGLQAGLGKYLDRLAAEDAEGFRALVDEYFGARLGVSEAEVREWRDALRAAATAREAASPTEE